jgi:hypothetical protein
MSTNVDYKWNNSIMVLSDTNAGHVYYTCKCTRDQHEKF